MIHTGFVAVSTDRTGETLADTRDRHFSSALIAVGLLAVQQIIAQVREYNFYKKNGGDFSVDSEMDHVKLDRSMHYNDLRLTNWQRFYLFRPACIAMLVFLGYDDSRSALTKAPTFYVSGIVKKFSSPEALLHAEQLTLLQHLKSASKHNTIVS